MKHGGLVGIVALVAHVAACDTGAGMAAGGDEVVARNGEIVVTRAELQAELASTVGNTKNVPAPTMDAMARKLMRRRALAAEARRRGLDQQPAMKRQVEQMLVAALEREVRQEATSVVRVTKAEISEHYTKNLDRFTRPRMVSAACVLAGSEDEAREQGEKLGAALRRYQPDLRLERLVGKGTSIRRYGYFGKSSVAVPRPVLEAALAAKAAPSVQGPVRLRDDSWCVVLIDAIRPGTTIALDAVQDRLRNQLEQEARRKAEKALLSSAYDEAATQVDPAAF